jgi:predicted Zn finger-like uncharacterized protein
MITCCPACSTLFKVAPEQLQIAGGWVRCGQCMAVFDARARMLPADPYVPSDFGWDEEAEAGDAPPSDLAQAAPRAPAPAERNRAADTTERDTDAVAPPSPKPAAVETPVSAAPAFEPPPSAPSALDLVSPASSTFGLIPPAPAFELVPPPKPEEVPAAAPVFTEPPPAPAAVPEASVTNPVPEKAAAPTPPLPIPTRDELDRRHAKLLERLAQLREQAEKRKSELEEMHPAVPDDAGPEPAPRAGEPNSRPQRDVPVQDADRDAHHHGASADQTTAHPQKREREDRRRVPEHSTARNPGRSAAHQESDKDLASRPIIDFVLSEIGRLPLPASASSQPEHPLQAAPELPSFIEQARRRAFWALPQVRAGLWGVALALGLMLAAQIAVGQRDRLAAQYPGAVPLLQTLCRHMQCQIAPWRHLGAVAIDSSAFVRTGPSAFDFAVTLRNNSAAPVATPALDLALIDAQDQPLARRVLNPADWGAPPQLAAYGEFNGTAALTVLDAAHPQAVSNYRLTAFYP